MNRLKAIRIVAMILVVAAVYSLSVLADAVKQDYKASVKESECVGKMVHLGLPRKEIVTGGGTCKHLYGEK